MHRGLSVSLSWCQSSIQDNKKTQHQFFLEAHLICEFSSIIGTRSAKSSSYRVIRINSYVKSIHKGFILWCNFRCIELNYFFFLILPLALLVLFLVALVIYNSRTEEDNYEKEIKKLRLLFTGKLDKKTYINLSSRLKYVKHFNTKTSEAPFSPIWRKNRRMNLRQTKTHIWHNIQRTTRQTWWKHKQSQHWKALLMLLTFEA